MDATTAQPTLLSAAKNFMRKSAGKAALVIAPLAAVALAPEAKAQTMFSFSSVSWANSGNAYMGADLPSGSRFVYSGGTTNNISESRFGAEATFNTFLAGVSGYGTFADNTLQISSTVTNLDIPAATLIPVTYDFTLTKQAGIAGNVTWNLNLGVTGDGFISIASGSLTTGSATFTGSGNYFTSDIVPSDLTRDFTFYLELIYTTAIGDALMVTMNSASQGYTLNATAIPEPSTYAAIFGLGALGFVVLRRARRCAA